jgi:hypothetical protein
MHYSCYARPGHHRVVQSELKRQLIGYCHKENPVMDAKVLHTRYDDAVRNAKHACKQRENEGDENGDPSTTVYQLTEQIRIFGKR